MTLADHYRPIAELDPHPLVPPAVRDQFDKARSVLLYSWFDYDLIPVSDGLAYGALELALRLRLAPPDGAMQNPPGLSGLLRIAVERQWLRDDRLPSFVRRHGDGGTAADPQAFCRSLPQLLSLLRNEFAHGNNYVYPPGSALSGLELIVEIINQLFCAETEG